MSKANQQPSATKNVATVTPPTGFCYIEETLARCVGPLTRHHIGFLRSPQFPCGCIVNISGEELDLHIELFAHEHNITVHNLFHESQMPFTESISLTEEWFKKSLEFILDLMKTNPIALLVGGSRSCIDCALIACLRRVQHWSITSALGEFRLNAGCRLFDVEQFIECFNPDIVDVTKNCPESLQIHLTLTNEEQKLLAHVASAAAAAEAEAAQRVHQSTDAAVVIEETSQDGRGRKEQGVETSEAKESSKDSSSSSSKLIDKSDTNTNKTLTDTETEQEENNNSNNSRSSVLETEKVLVKLLFSDKQLLISDAVQYDPLVSLINDKDDDD